MSTVRDLTEYAGHERVSFHYDETSGLHAIVALHTLFEGRACGGIRFRPYSTERAGLRDVLKLSEAMTYKAVLANLPVGGAKSVLFYNPEADRDTVLYAMAEAVHRLGGVYVCAPDMGISSRDLELIERITPFVVGHRHPAAPYTASGSVRAIEAAALWTFGQASLSGLRINVQGVGSVGAEIVRLLVSAGADVAVSDVNDDRVREVSEEFSTRVVDSGEMLSTPGDILVPCAAGGVLTTESVERLAVRAVAGPANNQLASLAVGDHLRAKGIDFVPDFIASAGGLIAGVNELGDFDELAVKAAIADIAQTAREVLEVSASKDVTSSQAALDLARMKLASRKGML